MQRVLELRKAVKIASCAQEKSHFMIRNYILVQLGQQMLNAWPKKINTVSTKILHDIHMCIKDNIIAIFKRLSSIFCISF